MIEAAVTALAFTVAAWAGWTYRAHQERTR